MKKIGFVIVFLVVFSVRGWCEPEQRRKIIHIQDPHSNDSGQMSLAQELDAVLKKESVSLVLVEGGWGDVGLNALKQRIPNLARAGASRQLLREGMISGEEYLSLTSDRPMKIVGVEDERLYRRCVKAYVALAQARESNQKNLVSIRRGLTAVKYRVYPRSFIEYERQRKINSSDMRPLFQLAAELRVDLSVYPSLKKISYLLKKEAQPLSNHQPLAAQDPTDQIGLDWDWQETLREWRELECALYQKGLVDENARLTRAIDCYVTLLEKAYAATLTSEEFAQIKGNQHDFNTRSYLAFLNRILLERNDPEDVVLYSSAFERSRRDFFRFYRLAEIRDALFLANACREMGRRGQATAVLITGGFHTEHLRRLFLGQDYDFQVITPHVTSETNWRRYESQLLSMNAMMSSGLMARALSAETVRVSAAATRLPQVLQRLDEATGQMLAGARLAAPRDLEAEFVGFWNQISGPERLGPAAVKYKHLMEPLTWEAIRLLAKDQDVFLGPQFVEIHLTEHCNNDCGYCRIKNGEGLRTVPDQEESLPLAHIRTVVDDLFALNPNAFVRFSGTIGEPLLNKHAKEIFQRLNGYRMRWGLVTNGLLLENVSDEVLGAEYVNVSVDAGSDDTYVQLKRPKGSFRKKPYTRILQNIQRFSERRNRSGSKTKIVVSLVLQSQNYREIPALARDARRAGADQFQIKMQHTDERRAMSGEELIEAYRLFEEARAGADSMFSLVAIHSLKEALKMAMRPPWDVPLAGLLPNTRSKGPVQTVDFGRCFANMLGLNALVDPRGALRACCQIYQSILPVQGNAQNGLKVIWESAERKDSLRLDPRAQCVSCSPSDLFVNRFVQFLKDANRQDPTFIGYVESKYIRPSAARLSEMNLSIRRVDRGAERPIRFLALYGVSLSGQARAGQTHALRTDIRSNTGGQVKRGEPIEIDQKSPSFPAQSYIREGYRIGNFVWMLDGFEGLETGQISQVVDGYRRWVEKLGGHFSVAVLDPAHEPLLKALKGHFQTTVPQNGMNTTYLFPDSVPDGWKLPSNSSAVLYAGVVRSGELIRAADWGRQGRLAAVVNLFAGDLRRDPGAGASVQILARLSAMTGQDRGSIEKYLKEAATLERITAGFLLRSKPYLFIEKLLSDDLEGWIRSQGALAASA